MGYNVQEGDHVELTHELESGTVKNAHGIVQQCADTETLWETEYEVKLKTPSSGVGRTGYETFLYEDGRVVVRSFTAKNGEKLEGRLTSMGMVEPASN